MLLTQLRAPAVPAACRFMSYRQSCNWSGVVYTLWFKQDLSICVHFTLEQQSSSVESEMSFEHVSSCCSEKKQPPSGGWILVWHFQVVVGVYPSPSSHHSQSFHLVDYWHCHWFLSGYLVRDRRLYGR